MSKDKDNDERIDKILSLLEKQAENSLSTENKLTAVTNGMTVLTAGLNGVILDVGQIKERMQTYEDTVSVTRNQANSLRSAIHKRTKELLHIEYDDNGNVIDRCIYDDKHYRGRMIQRCYADARKHSGLGTPYYSTYKKDYVETLDYINEWVPIEGIKGFKEYCDKRRNA